MRESEREKETERERQTDRRTDGQTNKQMQGYLAARQKNRLNPANPA